MSRTTSLIPQNRARAPAGYQVRREELGQQRGGAAFGKSYKLLVERKVPFSSGGSVVICLYSEIISTTFYKLQRRRIHAIPQPRRLRTIIKQMAQMRVA